MLSPTTHRFSALTAVLSTVRMGSQAQKGCHAIKSEHVWSHCFPSVCVKKRLNLNSLSFRHRLTSFGDLQVNEASAGTKQGSQLSWGWWMSLLQTWMIHACSDTGRVLSGEQKHCWDTELYWQHDKIHFLFLFRCFLPHLKTWYCKAAACSRFHHAFFLAGTFAYCLLAGQRERIKQKGNRKYQ